jgi:uncharacterized protein YjiS (DUF1127 family)
MTAIHDATGPVSAAWPRPRILRYVLEMKRAIERRRQCRGVRADLQRLSDRELFDIGISRGEIDYAAGQHAGDPRGALQ